jgi:hypothetical protein
MPPNLHFLLILKQILLILKLCLQIQLKIGAFLIKNPRTVMGGDSC